MRSTPNSYSWILVALVLVSASGSARAQVNCLFSEDFTGAELPVGWGLAPGQVERLDASGNGTGQFTSPFTVGTSLEANAIGYFPVPNDPIGNRFAMANDDAQPCDCAMDQVSLLTPFISLTIATTPALSFRYYHDGRPFNGRAWVDISTDGSAWTTLSELSEAVGVWQSELIDLSAYDGISVQLRFRYDDNGDWSSGFALDDVCVFGRTANDLALAQAWLGDPRTSPFNTSERSLGYTQLPVEQQLPLATTVRIRNLGTQTATGISIDGTLTLNGGQTLQSGSIVCNELLPLSDTIVQWNPGFTYTEAGLAELALSVSMANIDDQTTDNNAQLSYTMTAPGQNGHAMAIDSDVPETTVGGSEAFSTGCRFELTGPESHIHGVSLRFGGGTMPGTPIKATITDGNLNILSTSAEHIVSQADIDLSYAGGSTYLPLESILDFNSDQDILALIKFEGDTGALNVASGGTVPLGAAWLVEANGLNSSFLALAPLVRIHMSEPAVGLSEQITVASGSLTLMPNPTNTHAIVELDESLGGPWAVEVYDTRGQLKWRTGGLSEGTMRLSLSVIGWVPGVYTLHAVGTKGLRTGRLVVTK
ncbi:MAG: T9SS type A sorting domain-containing protein [Flavobacteriales bacterium]|nr:T9SS type A sorting domain-containing protein [Flavobacteriales bacterium]